ncbi:MAG: RNA-binding S4 domain-containing protein [Lewinellaceae bacterium]|nr:RNA-binding S4 domain-containing protein [Lewinellaceae bacterium]
MKTRTFDIKGQEFIQLNNLLKVLHLVGTGGEANMRIVSGEVMVNGKIEIQKRKKLRPGDTVLFLDNQILIAG